MSRAVLYCTVNGVCNNTNGLGRQTKTLLSALQRHRAELINCLSPFDVHVACPQPGPDIWAFDPADLATSRRVVASWGGLVHALPYDTRAAFWSPPTWQALSQAGAGCAVELARRYDELLVIAVDTPFAGLGEEVSTRRKRSRIRCRVDVLLAFYSTALIVERPRPDPARVAWERRAIECANTEADVWIGDVGRFLSLHLQVEYGLSPERLVPFTSSLDLLSPDLGPMSVPAAREVAARWRVPLDRPLVVTIGRTDPTKGIDILIDAVGPLRDEVHVVIIAVPFGRDDPLIGEYTRHIARQGLRATLVTEYTRELPRALCGLPGTRVVACASRGETLSNVPFEVALWAEYAGPVVVAPRRDGFVEQIDDGVTGVLYDPAAPGGLTAAIRHALGLTEVRRAGMRAAAHARVRAERDVVRNLTQMLAFFWPSQELEISESAGEEEVFEVRAPDLALGRAGLQRMGAEHLGQMVEGPVGVETVRAEDHVVVGDAHHGEVGERVVDGQQAQVGQQWGQPAARRQG
ncbi:MAG: glycosyltransferase [Pseudonocardiaceae bacterium]